jgi:hypothetical protein
VAVGVYQHEENQKAKGKRQKSKGKGPNQDIVSKGFFIFAFCLLPFAF